MPSSLAAAMLAEMQGTNAVYPVFEITLGSTVYRFSSETGVNSLANGVYMPYITGMSGFTREADSTGYTLVIPTPSVSIYDVDRVLQKAIGGPQRNNIRGSSVAAYFRSPNVAEASHYQFFSGIVENYGISGDREFQFTLSPDVDKLNGQPRIPYLTDTDFPTAPTEFLNQPLWIVYGKHSSSGVVDTTGMVQCLPSEVDSNGDCLNWICSYGQMTIQRLFLNGVDDTANWGFYTLERGRNRYQMAIYTGGGTNPTPDDTVTIDCEGLFAAAPVSGTTTPFENPAECLRNFLAHFVYGDGDVRAGQAWESETGKPIASGIFDDAETYFNTRGDVLARVVRADERVIDVLNDCCSSFDMVPMFDDSWGIGAIPEDEADTDIYHDDRLVSQRDRDNIGPLQMSTIRSKPITEIVVNYLLADASNTLTESGTVTDASAANIVRETFDLKWGKARAF